jgi:hypothetical protein
VIDVKGRPRRSWVLKLIPGEGGLLLRLDDDDDPEYWEEIRIPETDLLRLLARVHFLSHSTTDTAHERNGQ